MATKRPRITAQTLTLRVTLTADANLNLPDITHEIRLLLDNSQKLRVQRPVTCFVLSRTTHYGEREEPRGEE